MTITQAPAPTVPYVCPDWCRFNGSVWHPGWSDGASDRPEREHCAEIGTTYVTPYAVEYGDAPGLLCFAVYLDDDIPVKLQDGGVALATQIHDELAACLAFIEAQQ